jgi:hypothetical protein
LLRLLLAPFGLLLSHQCDLRLRRLLDYWRINRYFWVPLVFLLFPFFVGGIFELRFIFGLIGVYLVEHIRYIVGADFFGITVNLLLGGGFIW